MRIHPLLLTVLLGSAVCACSDSNQTSAPATPSTQAKDKVIFESQLQALEKAKGVEKTLQLDAQHLNESIEKQSAPLQ